MKFGKLLSVIAIDAWRSHYVDYRLLKRLLISHLPPTDPKRAKPDSDDDESGNDKAKSQSNANKPQPKVPAPAPTAAAGKPPLVPAAADRKAAPTAAGSSIAMTSTPTTAATGVESSAATAAAVDGIKQAVAGATSNSDDKSAPAAAATPATPATPVVDPSVPWEERQRTVKEMHIDFMTALEYEIDKAQVFYVRQLRYYDKMLIQLQLAFYQLRHSKSRPAELIGGVGVGGTGAGLRDPSAPPTAGRMTSAERAVAAADRAGVPLVSLAAAQPTGAVAGAGAAPTGAGAGAVVAVPPMTPGSKGVGGFSFQLPPPADAVAALPPLTATTSPRQPAAAGFGSASYGALSVGQSPVIRRTGAVVGSDGSAAAGSNAGAGASAALPPSSAGALVDLKAGDIGFGVDSLGLGLALGVGVGVGLIEANKTTISVVAKHLSHDLILLKSFVEVNRTAVRKILKKHDKTTRVQTKDAVLQRVARERSFFPALGLQSLTTDAEHFNAELSRYFIAKLMLT